MDTLETINLVKLIADGGFSLVLAIILYNALRGMNAMTRDASAMQIKALDVMGNLSKHISASTDAITDLKRSEDTTQTIVADFRGEVKGAHGAQVDKLNEIVNALAPLPGVAAAVGRIEPGLVDIRTAVESARDIAAQTALSLDSVLNKLDTIKARPAITPGNSIETSVERVRTAEMARAGLDEYDKQHGDGHRGDQATSDGAGI